MYFNMKFRVVSEENGQYSFPLVAVTNLDFAKMLHIGKGEIIGFARPESEEVLYIATTDEVGMDPYVDNAPHNWIPPRKRKTLNQDSQTVGERKCDRTFRRINEIENTTRFDNKYDEGQGKGNKW